MTALVSWLKENWWRTASIAMLVLIVVIGLVFTASSFSNTISGAPQSMDRAAQLEDYQGQGDSGSDGQSDTVEIQEGSMTIETDAAEQTADTIANQADSEDGYTESRRKSVTSTSIRIHMTVRIPDGQFTDFTDTLREQYNTEQYSIRNYRVSVQRERDEIELINRSIQDFEDIRELVNRMDDIQERSELLVTLTEKQLELKRMQEEFKREKEDKQQQSDMATLRLTIEEQRTIDLVPDDIGTRFMEAVRDMVDTVVSTTINLLTGIVEVFVKSIMWAVYIVIGVIPFYLGYLLLRYLYRKVN